MSGCKESGPSHPLLPSLVPRHGGLSLLKVWVLPNLMWSCLLCGEETNAWQAPGPPGEVSIMCCTRKDHPFPGAGLIPGTTDISHWGEEAERPWVMLLGRSHWCS